MRRHFENSLGDDLKRKMVFVAGPRQVGKTALAKSLLPGAKGYLRRDIPEHRGAILRRQLPAGTCTTCLRSGAS